MNQPLTTMIASAYTGAMITDKYSEGKSYKMVGVSDYEGNIQVVTGKLESDWWNVGICQLLLTPIEKTGDENAAIIASIFVKNKRASEMIWIGKAILIFHFTENTPWDDSEFDTAENRKIVSYRWSAPQFGQLIDYCRANSIDVGFMEIHSLIKAGIAIDKTIGAPNDERSVATVAS